MMKIPQMSCEQFVDELFSSAPAPGGGGAAALAGALGTALAGMVCSLTVGKPAFAAQEAEIRRIMAQAEEIKHGLMLQMQLDADNFYPLSRCYRMPETTEAERAEKAARMQEALKLAIAAPAEIIRLSYRALKLHEALDGKGNPLAVSDAGCGVVCLKAAMQSAWVTVLTNLKFTRDAAYVAATEAELLPMLREGGEIADRIYKRICGDLTAG